MSDPEEAEFVFGDMSDDDDRKPKRSSKSKPKKSSASAMDTDVSGGDARLALLQSKLAELSKHANINYDNDLPMSPVGSPEGVSHMDSLKELMKLKQQLQEEQARKSEASDDDDDELDSFIDVQSLLEDLDQSGYTRPSVPKIDTNAKFNELCREIRERDAVILNLEAKVHEMNREAIDFKEMINERDKLIGSKNEAVAVVQNKFKKELQERDHELKKTQDLLFDMEKRLSSVQESWKQEKDRLTDIVDSQQEDKKRLTSEIEEKDHELKRTQEKLSDMEKRLSSAEDSWKQEKDRLTDMTDSHQGEKERLISENQDLKSKNGKIIQKFKALKEKYDRLTKECENLKISKASEDTDQINQLQQYLELSQQQAQTLQQELLQRDQELTHLKDFYDPQIAQLTSLNERLEQSRDSVKELESNLHSKDDELHDAQVKASDDSLKFQLLLEEKNSLVFQVESLAQQIEQLKANQQSVQSVASSQPLHTSTHDSSGSAFINWGDQPAPTTVGTVESDWWSPKDNSTSEGDWGGGEQSVELVVPSSSSNPLEELQHQVEEKEHHIHCLNVELNRLQLSINELQQGKTSLTAAYEELATQNQQQAQTLQQELLQRDQELTHLKDFYDPQIAQLTSLNERLEQSRDELSSAMAEVTKHQESVKELESRLTDMTDSHQEEKERLISENQDLKSKNGKIIQKFKALKEKYDRLTKECENLKISKASEDSAEINQLQQHLELSQQHAQTLQQELLQRDQELTHLKVFYDPQIAQLTSLNESLEQSRVELSSALAELSKQQESVKELESRLQIKDNELYNVHAQASDEALKFQLLLEEKNSLVLQVDTLNQQVEQLKSNQQSTPSIQQQPAPPESSGSAFINWGDQPATTTVESDWWSPKDSASEGDWGGGEQSVELVVPSSSSNPLEELQHQVEEKEHHIHCLNVELNRLQLSINELQQGKTSLTAAYEELATQNQQQAQTLQQELLQRDQELTHLKDFYDPQIAQLTSLNERLEQSRDELSSAMAELTKQHESVKELESRMQIKDNELCNSHAKASDEALKFQLLLEEKNCLVLQVETLNQQIEQANQQLATGNQPQPAPLESSGSAFINWGDQPATTTVESDWWSPKDSASEGDWGGGEQSVELVVPSSSSNPLEELQHQVEEKEHHIHCLNVELNRLQLSINELQQGKTSLTAAYEELATQNQQQAQTLQQELLQRDQELTHLKDFYDPQIAQLTSINERLEQSRDELCSALAELTKQQESVKELESRLQIKDDELYNAHAQASDKALKLELATQNLQQVQTLQQELLQRDQELTHLKEFYDPQIAQLTALNERLEQARDELSSALTELTKQKESVKVLESHLHSKDNELYHAHVKASDEALKFQLLLEEKNSLVFQVESLAQQIEQLKANQQLAPGNHNQPQPALPESSGSAFMNWEDQPATTTVETDWWSPKDSASEGDWGGGEQSVELVVPSSSSNPLEELQHQVEEKEQHIQYLNVELNRLQLSINELQQGKTSLTAAYEELANQNQQQLEEISRLVSAKSGSELSSPVELSASIPQDHPESDESISLFRAPDSVDSTQEEKNKMSAEIRELKVKNGKMIQKFKVLKDKYDGLVKENETLKRKSEFSLEGAMEEELLKQLKEKDETVQENSKIIMELKGEKEQLAQKIDLLERANDKLLEMKEGQGRYIEQLLFEKKQLEQEISGLKWKLEEVAESSGSNVPTFQTETESASSETKNAYQEDLEELRKQNFFASQEITSLQQDNADLIAAVEELNRRNLLLQSQGGQQQHSQPVQVQATATTSTSDDPAYQAAGPEFQQLRLALEHERNEKAILERKIELLQSKILEIETSEIKAFEESFMLKNMTRILEMDNSKYQDELQQLLNSSSDGDGGAKVKTLQNEVLRLVDTLQERDKRCEELTVEITRLLEERDGLQLKLSNVLKHNVSLNEKCYEGIEMPSGEVPTFDKEGLQLKLAELEQVNFSINLDLRREKEARRIVQEQLLFSQSSRIYRDLTRNKPISLSPIKSSSPIPPRTPAPVQFSPVPASIPPPVHIFTPLSVTVPENEARAAPTGSSPPSPVQQM